MDYKCNSPGESFRALNLLRMRYRSQQCKQGATPAEHQNSYENNNSYQQPRSEPTHQEVIALPPLRLSLGVRRNAILVCSILRCVYWVGGCCPHCGDCWLHCG